MSKVINLFGGPGVGKSTYAAYLFARMKVHGISCELVTEFAKDLVWENNYNRLSNQLCVLAEQFQRLHRVVDKVDYIISDSPLLMQIMYNTNPLNKEDIDNLIYKLFSSFDNINVFLQRNKTRAYDPIGRLQTFEEACQIDETLLALINKYDVPYHLVEADVGNVYSFLTEQIIKS